MFGKLFGKKVTKTLDAVKKFENKDLAEAAIGAAMLIASADGEIEDSELQTLQAVVTSMDQFKHHQSEIGIMIDKYAQLLKAGALIGKMNIMREIAVKLNFPASRLADFGVPV